MKKAFALTGFLIAGLIPLIIFGVVWTHARNELANADIGAKPTTGIAPTITTPLAPLLSARRMPVFLATDVRRRGYAVSLAPVVKALPKDGTCFVVSVDGSEVLDSGGQQPVVPASNLKLFTAAVALDVLGPDFTYSTSLNGTVAGSIVQGDLYLVGSGDPLLSTADYINSGFSSHTPFNVTPFEQLASQLKAAGVTHITGGIIGDDSRYDQERYDPSWTQDVPNTASGVGPTSALLLNDGWTPKQGGFGAGIRKGVNPPLVAAQRLKALLVQNGIAVDGNASADTMPPGQVAITAVQSAKLTDIVKEMLTNSDNNTAEMMLREIGVKVAGKGTRADGAAAVMTHLTGWGIPGVSMVDGSGLDHANRVTCDAMVAVLAREGGTGVFHDAMSVAGQSGTLAKEFVGTKFAGQFFGKTGTLSVSKALSGYFPTATGTVEFALIVNVPEGSLQQANELAKPIWALLPGTMSASPPGPSVDALAPGGS